MTKKQKTAAIAASCSVVLIAAVCLTGMVSIGGGAGGPGEGEEEAVTEINVNVGTPEIGSIYVSTEFIGTVEPNQQVKVYPKASGEILNTYYNVGEEVQKGAVLMNIDSFSLESSIAQTKASLEKNEALTQFNLQNAEEDLETYQNNVMEGLNASLLAAQSQVDNAKLNVETSQTSLQSANSSLSSSRRTLREANSGDSDTDYTDDQIKELRDTVTTREYAVENAQVALDSAEQGLAQAEANLEAVKKQIEEQETSTTRTVTQAQINANLTSEYLALEKMESDLADYTVTAPISGTIEEINVDPFDMATSATAAYVISNKDLMLVSFNVTETAMAYIAVGDGITVEKGSETSAGTITEISTAATSTGLFTVKASVDASTASFSLYSGSTVKVNLNTQKAEDIITIPVDAVYHESNVSYVFVLRDGVANRVDIETGITDNETIEVLSGLTLGDQIIVTWSANLKDGVSVKVAGSASETDSPSTPAEGDDN